MIKKIEAFSVINVILGKTLSSYGDRLEWKFAGSELFGVISKKIIYISKYLKYNLTIKGWVEANTSEIPNFCGVLIIRDKSNKELIRFHTSDFENLEQLIFEVMKSNNNISELVLNKTNAIQEIYEEIVKPS